ncbi:MAG TPA: fatty acid desaturase [Holophaga sp.]|nr:fatty acid desaturase [Holophaga sp.]
MDQEARGRKGEARAYPLTAASLTFGLIHLAALGVFAFPFRPGLAWMALALYLARMFGVTAGYHRYFSHRAYRLGRPAQFLLACLAQSSGQKGVLWWAAHHRDHHRHSDGPGDVHSPVRDSFWWSHVGWILSSRYDAVDPVRVRDLARYPELRWLDRHHWVPALALALGAAAWAGPAGLAWWALSTVVLYHATFSINSLAHVWGTRAFATPDRSRNNALLALLTLGEGWHNNHHACPGASSHRVRWWEADPTQAGLRILSALGVVRDLRGRA